MEISDYLGLIRLQLRRFLLIPVIAGAVAAVWVLATQSTRYVAAASVPLSTFAGPSSTSTFSGTQGVRLLIANFRAAARSPEVLNRVAGTTGVSLEELAKDNAVAVTQVGDSSIVRVTTRLPDLQTSEDAARAVAAETVRYLLAPEIEVAQRLLTEAERAAEEVSSEMAELGSSTGLTLGVTDYELRARELTTLREELLRAQAGGSTTLARALQQSIDTKSAELAALKPQVAQFQALSAESAGATARVNRARENLSHTQALQNATDSELLITVSLLRKESLAAALLRNVAGAMAAGLFVAILLIAAVEYVGRPRSEQVIEPREQSKRIRAS